MDSVARPDGLDGTESEIDIEAARRQIRARGEEICQRELSRAFRRLEAHGSLSERDRQVIRTLAEQLTDELLAQPEKSLRTVASDDTSAETARVALELFGDEPPPESPSDSH